MRQQCGADAAGTAPEDDAGITRPEAAVLDLRRFRIGRRKGQTPYGLLGLKLPDLSFWEFLKLTPGELREKLSALGDTP
jgi:hypothetical protein